LCAADVDGVAKYVNGAQRRLLYCREAGEESYWGTFAEVAFNVDPESPYITCPRGIARLELMDVCKCPVVIHNQFYEYLRYGNGRMPKYWNRNTCLREAYSRNNAVTFVEMPAGSYIRIYPTVASDVTKRVLIQGVDTNGNVVYSNDGTNRINGQFISLEFPFAQTSFQLNSLTGIQKDITAGDLQFFAVDPITGAETLLLTMEPGEQTASYRRYYLNALPPRCCPTDTTVQVSAIAKLDFIPVRVDTDYTLLQNIEAIIEEAQSMRYSRIDSTSAKAMAAEKHTQAVRLLNGELTHYLGKNEPAITFSPFNGAKLEYVNIGMI